MVCLQVAPYGAGVLCAIGVRKRKGESMVKLRLWVLAASLVGFMGCAPMSQITPMLNGQYQIHTQGNPWNGPAGIMQSFNQAAAEKCGSRYKVVNHEFHKNPSGSDYVTGIVECTK
jgi:hypothetical protein